MAVRRSGSGRQPGRAATARAYGNMRSTPTFRRAPADAGSTAQSSRVSNAGIPAHSPPLGCHFLQGSSLPAPWSAGAVVAVHGSWDRERPRAPAALWLPWETRTRTLGPAITLVGEFQEPNGSRWGRTVDAVPGPDGALYLSDDQDGAIYRIVPDRPG